MPALRRPSESAGVMVRKVQKGASETGTAGEGGPQCAFTAQKCSSAVRTPERCRVLGMQMCLAWSLLRQRPYRADGPRESGFGGLESGRSALSCWGTRSPGRVHSETDANGSLQGS